MLSPVALAAGDFLTWRIRLPDSGSKFSGRQLYNLPFEKLKTTVWQTETQAVPHAKKEKNVWNSIPHRWMPHAEAS